MKMSRLFALLLTLCTVLAAMPAGAGESMAAAVRLNVRGGPGLDYPVLDTLRVGERVLINTCQNDWCRITHVGIDGWVFAPYLVSATFTQTWRATSRNLPATLDNGAAAPDIGALVGIDPAHRCPDSHPFC